MSRDLKNPFAVSLAVTSEDVRAAQQLRYKVFVEELGGSGPLVDHEEMIERDAFDDHADHMIVRDERTNEVVGVYRLMRQHQAQAAGGFYSASEYDLTVLTSGGRSLLELGRSCLHPDYRGGLALHTLWSGLASYIAEHDVDVLFGVASFHGTNIAQLSAPLSYLHYGHLAPAPLRVRARGEPFQPMDLIPNADLDRRAALRQIPALIKAYLRLGGFVGEGAFIDRAFNTTDVCLILDLAAMNPRQARLYQGQGA